MPRMADRVVNREWGFPIGLNEKGSRAVLDLARNLMTGDPTESSRVIVADNVARYVRDREDRQILLDGYPSLAPPWDSFWIEYPSSSGRERRGVLCLDATFVLSDPERYGEPDNPSLENPISEMVHGAVSDAYGNGAVREDIQWVLSLTLLVENPDHRVWGPAGHMALALDEGGQVIGNRWSLAPLAEIGHARTTRWDSTEEREIDARLLELGVSPEWLARFQSWDPTDVSDLDEFDGLPTGLGQVDAAELVKLLAAKTKILRGHSDNLHEFGRIMDSLTEAGGVPDALMAQDDSTDTDPTWLIAALEPALQTITFLHCKNIETADHVPSGKVQKRRGKRGKKPMVRYQTVNLMIPRKGGGGKGGGGGGMQRSLHIVAGHFAHYGACCTNHPPKGKLFGRLEGVYWHPMHARGTEDEGVVHTDWTPKVR